MRVDVLGGGPGGLYAALLLKQRRPEAAITVFERNRADDTFGWGVVFSGATLANFRQRRPCNPRRDHRQLSPLGDHPHLAAR